MSHHEYGYKNLGNTSLVSKAEKNVEININREPTPTEILGKMIVALAVSGSYSAALGHESITSIATAANAEPVKWTIDGISTANLAAYGESQRQREE